jgi:succinoglycan biosynthesis protein ExoA
MISTAKDNSKPRISVVIPTLNEAMYIAQALQCILNNDIPPQDLEVLLIDGGSCDGTVEIARGFESLLRLHVIEEPGCSVYRALNLGLLKAQGDFFIRVDARSLIPKNYIETCLRDLDIHGAKCAGGIQLQFGDSPVSNSIARVTSSVIGTGGAKFRTSKISGFVDSVYLGVYRSATLRELGGFEEGADYVSEDAFINQMIRARGEKVYLNVSLQVRYPAKASFRALAKQYLIYGAAKGFIFQKYYKLTSFRQVLPLMFLLSWISLSIACMAGWIPWVALGTAACAYLLLVFASNISINSSVDQSQGLLWARSFATICIHFTWPIGFFMFLINSSLHKRLVKWV